VNHCLLEVEVLEAPQIRYTQDNQTPVAEMAVRFDGLRPDDPPGQIRVVGWGSLAQDLQNRVQVGQRLVLEGRLRMNTVSRPDGVKEKRAEFTLSRLHPSGGAPAGTPIAAEARGMGAPNTAPVVRRVGAAGSGTRAAAPATATPAPPAGTPAEAAAPVWNTSPLVADPEGFDEEDDIPF
jgi:single-stranded DNA-binding protein